MRSRQSGLWGRLRELSPRFEPVGLLRNPAPAERRRLVTFATTVYNLVRIPEPLTCPAG